MDNKTCYCLPFYTGEFCETYKGCPNDLPESVCEEILKQNKISQVTLDVERGGLLSFYAVSYTHLTLPTICSV